MASQQVFRRLAALAVSLVLAGCAATAPPTSNANPATEQSTSSPTAQPVASNSAPRDEWRRATAEEETTAWGYILNSRLGIAALNQLAIEEFISPLCEKSWYVNEPYSGFQTLLRVQCPDERGASIARGYDEMRVIFNRFEDNIENFEVERVYPDQPPEINLGED